MFDYTLPFSMDNERAALARVSTSPVLVYYIYTIDPLIFHPYDEFGNPYEAADILEYGLEGTAGIGSLQNTAKVGSDIFYTVKNLDGIYSTSTLQSVVSGYEITGIKPKGILKVTCSTEDGVWMSYTSEQLDVDEVLLSTSNQ